MAVVFLPIMLLTAPFCVPSCILAYMGVIDSVDPVCRLLQHFYFYEV